jgi:hypothetical protein
MKHLRSPNGSLPFYLSDILHAFLCFVKLSAVSGCTVSGFPGVPEISSPAR